MVCDQDADDFVEGRQVPQWVGTRLQDVADWGRSFIPVHKPMQQLRCLLNCAFRRRRRIEPARLGKEVARQGYTPIQKRRPNLAFTIYRCQHTREPQGHFR